MNGRHRLKLKKKIIMEVSLIDLFYPILKKKKKGDLFYPFSSHISNRCVVDDEFHDCVTDWQIASILSTLTPDDLKGICPVGEHL